MVCLSLVGWRVGTEEEKVHVAALLQNVTFISLFHVAYMLQRN